MQQQQQQQQQQQKQQQQQQYQQQPQYPVAQAISMCPGGGQHAFFEKSTQLSWILCAFTCLCW